MHTHLDKCKKRRCFAVNLVGELPRRFLTCLFDREAQQEPYLAYLVSLPRMRDDRVKKPSQITRESQRLDVGEIRLRTVGC